MHIAVIIPYRSRDNANLPTETPQPADPLLQWTLDGYKQQRLDPAHTLELRIGHDGPSQRELPDHARDGRVNTWVWAGFPLSGAAAVRNGLARFAHARLPDILIFGNADARPDPDMVQRHVDALTQHPDAAMVLGSAPWELPQPPAQPTVFDALLANTPMVFFYHQLQAGQLYDFRHAWTLNLSIRYPDFLASGGFHDQLRPVYYEDLDFGYRLLGPTRKGILYEPAARVLHRHPTTLAQYLDREELLGLMAPVLARVCPEAFAAIFQTPDAQSLAPQYRAWIAMDHPMHRWIYRRLAEWATLPAQSLDPDLHEQTLMTIYQMHIPLKRLAFRLGYLRGLDLADDTHWQSRRPTSQWRSIVEQAAPQA